MLAVDSGLPRSAATRAGKAAVLANQGLGKTLIMVREVERVAAFDAEKIAIDAALVAIVSAHNFHAAIATAHAERGLAAVGTVGAGGADDCKTTLGVRRCDS